MNLEKLLFRSDKIISFFYNSIMKLIKQFGKPLHHLLLNMEFQMKEVVKKVLTVDISKIHNWIHQFETNKYLKQKKLFRNMKTKLSFYKAFDINVLQDAYNRLGDFLKQNSKLANKGEFSILNKTNTNIMLSMSRSFMGNRNLLES